MQVRNIFEKASGIKCLSKGAISHSMEKTIGEKKQLKSRKESINTDIAEYLNLYKK